MTDVAAPSSSYLDLQIPSTFRWRYGRVRLAPARVPELAPNAAPRLRHRGEGGRELHREVARLIQAPAEPEVIERDRLRIELLDLKAQIPALRRDRDDLRMELGDLNRQIPALRQERDELLATAVVLSAEVSDLQSKQQELIFLRAEIQELRKRKSSLEKTITTIERSITALCGSTEKTKRERRNNREFHDS